ncbi:hypothetical protein RFI_32321 [Reticulomyxa filosa]|uniref:Uncharacterized protein n=1 Tax=Reticulomyxa filosa TaxID=46433 RepID=X6LUL4_RETFI|nr:hypothetical protein RFI_32321 [Reticulomyxa filosa]|eukprot:ETO05076.1 hypothetical protein RFI_32321 [Reticulomyxa filosa]
MEMDESSQQEGNVTELSRKEKKELLKKVEKIRRSIQSVLHISRLKSELLGGLVSFPFESRSEWKYYSRLQVSLANIAPGCLSCFVLINESKPKPVWFSVREPDWLLLFVRTQDNSGFASIFMAFPIHCIQVGQSKQDPRILQLTIRSTVCPHECCLPLPNHKDKWQLALFFDSSSEKNVSQSENDKRTRQEAFSALDFIQSNCKRARRRIMNEIARLLAPDDTDNRVVNGKS